MHHRHAWPGIATTEGLDIAREAAGLYVAPPRSSKGFLDPEINS
jgi:hypothetical protein